MSAEISRHHDRAGGPGGGGGIGRVKSDWARAATASPACSVPDTPGDPVTAVPGLTPRSPLTTVPPVLVTVLAPNTPNVAADPSATGAWAAGVSRCRHSRATARRSPRRSGFVPLTTGTVEMVFIVFVVVVCRVCLPLRQRPTRRVGYSYGSNFATHWGTISEDCCGPIPAGARSRLGSAPAPGAVYRALAENSDGTRACGDSAN